MDKSEYVQVLTLWFVVLVFVQTGSGDGAIWTVLGLVSVVLMWAVPLYIVVNVVRDATAA